MTDGSGEGPRQVVDQRLPEWVRRGLITSQQADAIWLFEHSVAPVTAVGATAVGVTPSTGTPTNDAGGLPPVSGPVRRPRRIPVAAEVMAYLGGILATVAALLVIGPAWNDLGTSGQVILLVLVAVLLLSVGAWLFRIDDRSSEHLGGILWLGSLIAATGLSAVLADAAGHPGGDAVTLVAGVVATLVALVMWLLHRTAIQLAALVMSSGLLMCGVVLQLPWDSVGGAGLGFALLGALWVALGWRRLVTPDVVATGLGAVAVVVGLLLWSLTVGMTGVGCASAASAALLIVGATLSRTELLAVGAVGLLVSLPILISNLAGGALGVPLGLLVAAMALLAVASRFYRRVPR